MKKYKRREWIRDTSMLGIIGLLSPQLSVADSGDSYVDSTIYLNANENPYGPSTKAREAIKLSIDSGNRYPFSQATKLIESLAKRFGLDQNNFMLGAGSSQLLDQLGNWVFNKGLSLIYASPTFEILPNYIERLGGKVIPTSLTKDFKHDLEALGDVANKNPGVIYIVNPNNPTSTLLNADELKSFCDRMSQHSYIIIDEAYIEYPGEDQSMLDFIKTNDKIIIVRTFSKIFGIAGLRVGYAIAHQSIIKELSHFQIWRSASVSSTGIAAAIATLNDAGFVKSSRDKNERVRNQTVSALNKLGMEPCESNTNFIFFPTLNNDDLKSKLLMQNMLIGQMQIADRNYARITIGTENEMTTLIQYLNELYK